MPKYNHPMFMIAASILLLATQAYGEPGKALDTKASVYSSKLTGKKMSSGKRYQPGAMTAASKTLPIGSKVMVKNKRTGKQTTVTISDRCAGAKGHGIDLSKGAADKVGVKGVDNVSVTPMQIAHKGAKKPK